MSADTTTELLPPPPALSDAHRLARSLRRMAADLERHDPDSVTEMRVAVLAMQRTLEGMVRR